MTDWRVPHDPASEWQIVGWMMGYPSERRRVDLTHEDFHLPACQRVFSLLAGTSEYLSAVDVSVRAEVDLDALVNAVTDAPLAIARTVETVANLALRRRVQVLAHELEHGSHDPSTDEAALVDRVRDAAAHLTLPTREIAPPENIADFVAGGDEEPDWLVRGVFERGDRVLVCGAEGRGKSTFMRQMAVKCAAGLHPFKKYENTPPIQVLLVDLESGDRLVRRKMRPLWISARQENPNADPDLLRVEVRPEGVDFAGRAGRTWMAELLAAVRPELVVLGPLYKTYTGDMNEEQTARQVAALIDEWRAEYGCAWLLETHAPHGDGGSRRLIRPIGSSLWLRWPEMGVGLTEESESDSVKTTFFRLPRDAREWPNGFTRGGDWPWTAVWA